MIITFLGTSSGAPTTKRNVSGIALRFTQKAKWWLLDCGEGTQHQILRAPVKLSQLEKIFITHLHGDHLYGLIGLLASRSLRGGGETGVALYGPPGIKEYVDGIMAVSPVHLQYDLSIHTVSPGVIFEDDEIIVKAAAVAHRVPAYAYAIEEKARPGAFRVDLAMQAGIPAGPLFGQLKKGEPVTLPDGRVVEGRDFVGPDIPGRKVVYSGDTGPCQAIIELAADADVLIHEATYVHQEVDLARRAGHSTALEAAQAAKQANVNQLLLTHFSPRYESDEGITMDDLLAEARDIFPETELAEDFSSHEVKRMRQLIGE
ncbi:MAG TPA: ribonuclease Z [Candidatus Bathyarchaeia archaeon]|nr:ribonuclease Z [Candidatus Bathyarchaeia archaeon]